MAYYRLKNTKTSQLTCLMMFCYCTVGPYIITFHVMFHLNVPDNNDNV